MTKNQEIATLKQTTEQLQSSVKNWQAQWDTQYKLRCEESARFRKELDAQKADFARKLNDVVQKGLDAIQETKLVAERDTAIKAYQYLVDSLTANKQG